MPITVDGNGRFNGNGLFFKIIVGIIGGLSLLAISGGVVMYGEIQVLKSATSLDRRVQVLEDLANSINADRHQRTVILQGLKSSIDELQRRVDRLEQVGRVR